VAGAPRNAGRTAVPSLLRSIGRWALLTQAPPGLIGRPSGRFLLPGSRVTASTPQPSFGSVPPAASMSTPASSYVRSIAIRPNRAGGATRA
jgi:hypothetical protein